MKIESIKLTNVELNDAVEKWLGNRGIIVNVEEIDINKYVDRNYPVEITCCIIGHEDNVKEDIKPIQSSPVNVEEPI